MQEHIRRAHPEHYIAKLPATEDSFYLMINSAPSERPPIPQTSAPNSIPGHQSKPYAPDRNTYYRDESSNPGTPRHLDDYTGGLLPTVTTAAATLATLQGYKSAGSDWDGEAVSTIQRPSLNGFIVLITSPRTGLRILKEIEGRGLRSSYLQYTLITPISPASPIPGSKQAGPGNYSLQSWQPRLLADHLHCHPSRGLWG